MARSECMHCGASYGEEIGHNIPSSGYCSQECRMADLPKWGITPDGKFADVYRRIASGFYDSDIVNNQVANKIMQEAK